MGLWKDQKDMWKAVTSPEMGELIARSQQMERPSMLDSVRQANAMLDQLGDQQRLMATGIPGTARIESAQDTGASVNDQPVVDFGLLVEVPGRAPYRVAARQAVPRLMTHAYAPGQVVPVRVDPADTNQLIVDVAASAAPAAGPAIPAQDPTERLARLADLRDRGVLTESEFAAQKARILADL